MNVKDLPDNICALPWTAVNYRPTGKMAPCCDYDWIDAFEGTNVEDYKNSKVLKDIKLKFLHGAWPEGCKGCKIQEEKTGHSRRLQESQNYLGHIEKDVLTAEDLLKEDKHFYLNLALNNKCNLGCIMCNPGNSSFLLREFKQNSQHFFHNIDYRKQSVRTTDIEPNVKDETVKVVNPFNPTWGPKDVDDLVNTIDTNHGVKPRITFHGGEPTIMKEPYEILENVKSKGLQDKVIIEFNSNFQQYNPRWFDSLKGFQGHALISLDAIGKPGEYIRYPSEWKVVEKNILRFKKEYSEYFRITICPTLQIANIFYMESLIDWCYENNVGLTLNGLLRFPSQLAANNLPKDIKDNLIQRLKNVKYQQSFGRDERPAIVSLLEQDPSVPIEYTINYLDKIDNVRGTSWKESLPELYKSIKS